MKVKVSEQAKYNRNKIADYVGYSPTTANGFTFVISFG